MELKKKTVVITGGSQGFGKAMAAVFVREGATVIISSHEKESLESAARELQTDFFLADVTSPKDVNNLGQYVFKKYGRVDIWINNAGIQIAPSPVEGVEIEKLHRLFDINFFGYFYGCQTALRLMKEQGDGTILNVNSTAGLEGKPGISAYSASKFAIRGLTESLRKELEGTDIRVYGIHPGGMQTDIYREKYPDDLKEYMKVEPVVEKVIENLKSENPELNLVIKRPKII